MRAFPVIGGYHLVRASGSPEGLNDSHDGRKLRLRRGELPGCGAANLSLRFTHDDLTVIKTNLSVIELGGSVTACREQGETCKSSKRFNGAGVRRSSCLPLVLGENWRGT